MLHVQALKPHPRKRSESLILGCAVVITGGHIEDFWDDSKSRSRRRGNEKPVENTSPAWMQHLPAIPGKVPIPLSDVRCADHAPSRLAPVEAVDVQLQNVVAVFSHPALNRKPRWSSP